ncbi:hypothetical protein CY0110_27109 [Crocosphaera chwakensis CCY0110]|uniref:Uncharacterized protein n=2 Tax=Crocosphaera TaxID=263510 RepID=A3IVQ8_9CHRO|nr:hypothetical protein CY0110_27109 [Crocosphaera chwakensis CCY0110]
MKKILFLTFIVSFFYLLKYNLVMALPIPSFYQGMPYNEARTKMLELGWQVPIINNSQDCQFMQDICKDYPEVNACSETGVSFCLFIFTDANGKQFKITTAGRDPLEMVNWRNE